MKKNIHPNYHDITVQMTDGATFTTKSTWGKPNDTLVLERDIKTHPAWTGDHKVIENMGRASQFNSKFKDITLS